jgi:hypothetical protein
VGHPQHHHAHLYAAAPLLAGRHAAVALKRRGRKPARLAARALVAQAQDAAARQHKHALHGAALHVAVRLRRDLALQHPALSQASHDRLRVAPAAAARQRAARPHRHGARAVHAPQHAAAAGAAVRHELVPGGQLLRSLLAAAPAARCCRGAARVRAGRWCCCRVDRWQACPVCCQASLQVSS